MDVAIEVRELTKRYGTLKAIDQVSFSVEPGQVIGFLGPNGAGKSTTMRILCGLLAASSGAAFIQGIPVASHAYETKRKIGYMPEHNPLPEDMRVVEYLRFRARLKEIPTRQLKASVDEAMEVCDLHHKARRRIIRTLSKGFRQRVGIADAILAKPPVIIMDEPTIGLDPHQILGIRQLIDSLRGKMTVVLSSHILPEIELVCDKVIIINQGRIVANGTPANLRHEFQPGILYSLKLNASPHEVRKRLAVIDDDLKLRKHSEANAEGFFHYRVEGPQGADRIEEMLTHFRDHAGWRIREISQIQPTLEDVFLAATKRSWDETLDAPAGQKAKS